MKEVKTQHFQLLCPVSGYESLLSLMSSNDCSSRNVLPIVMGARPEDYARTAPYRSYIHVDEFESPEELAAYLHRLDMDDDLYNSYFRWKGTGEFINTYYFCRLCAMLHDDFPNKSYRNVNEITQQISRKLLRMDVLTPETC